MTRLVLALIFALPCPCIWGTVEVETQCAPCTCCGRHQKPAETQTPSAPAPASDCQVCAAKAACLPSGSVELSQAAIGFVAEPADQSEVMHPANVFDLAWLPPEDPPSRSRPLRI